MIRTLVILCGIVLAIHPQSLTAQPVISLRRQQATSATGQRRADTFREQTATPPVGVLGGP